MILPDGVYLGLDEATYFAQPRDGSTDLSRLFTEREGYWWRSHMNPDYIDEPDDAPSRTFGKALHAMILEGDRAYESRFSIIPSKSELKKAHGDLFVVTVGEMEEALEKRGMYPKRMKKTELIPYVRSRAPDLVIWDDVQETWADNNVGKLPVTAEEDRQLRIMAACVREHREIGPLFADSPDHIPLTEVSVLWTENHGQHVMRRRARFDALLPQYIVDLKTLANIGGRPLQFAVGDHVAKLSYHVQMADHHVARREAYRLIQAGAVHGGTIEERAWLCQFPERQPNWDYAWIFYQRPDSRRGLAPVVFPWLEERGSDLHLDGIRARRTAISTYLQCLARFGREEPWTRVEPVHSSAERSPHRVLLPHYIGQEYVAGEEDDI